MDQQNVLVGGLCLSTRERLIALTGLQCCSAKFWETIARWGGGTQCVKPIVSPNDAIVPEMWPLNIKLISCWIGIGNRSLPPHKNANYLEKVGRKIRPTIFRGIRNSTSGCTHFKSIHWFICWLVNFEVGSMPSTKFFIFYQYFIGVICIEAHKTSLRRS